MEIIADLHVHSRHSRATSKNLDLFHTEKYARIKGVNLLGTGDFTHPIWIEELKKGLIEDGSGILKSSTGFNFMLTTEISLIYSQDGKGRRVHLVILAPDFDTVDKITQYLGSLGRLDYDGRPIFNRSCIEVTEQLKNIDERIEIIPAHIWTPWFSIFGSKSGFDSIHDAFGDQVKHIHALETGLSSDPPMNWRISELDKFNLVSFSDFHSYWPWRLGREATVFDTEMNYDSIIKAIQTGRGLSKTIEVDPNYGKYHYDGHRNCNVCFSPTQTKEANGICPVCKSPLVIGVQNRVEELADRSEGFVLRDKPEFLSLLPLCDMIAMNFGCAVSTKKVAKVFDPLIESFGSEYNIMLKTDERDLLKVADPAIVNLIMKNRAQEITIKPGYDGEYGVPVLDDKK